MTVLSLTPATQRNTKAYWVFFQGVRVLFSYQTPVAFSYRGHCYRRHNDWGPTTGRHMNEAGVHQWQEVDNKKEFNEKLDEALLQSVADAVEYRMETTQ